MQEERANSQNHVLLFSKTGETCLSASGWCKGMVDVERTTAIRNAAVPSQARQAQSGDDPLERLFSKCLEEARPEDQWKVPPGND